MKRLQGRGWTIFFPLDWWQLKSCMPEFKAWIHSQVKLSSWKYISGPHNFPLSTGSRDVLIRAFSPKNTHVLHEGQFILSAPCWGSQATQSLPKSHGNPGPQAFTISTASCGERGGLCMVLQWWEDHDPSLVLLIPCSPPFSPAAASWNREGRWSTLSHGTSKYHLDTIVTLITASFSLKNVNLNRIINLNRKEGGEMPLSTVSQGPLHKFLCSE